MWSLGLESECGDLLEGLSLFVGSGRRCGAQGLMREHERVVQFHESGDFGLLFGEAKSVAQTGVGVVVNDMLAELGVSVESGDESLENVDLGTRGRDEHESPDGKARETPGDGEDDLLHIGSFRSGSLYTM